MKVSELLEKMGDDEDREVMNFAMDFIYRKLVRKFPETEIWTSPSSGNRGGYKHIMLEFTDIIDPNKIATVSAFTLRGGLMSVHATLPDSGLVEKNFPVKKTSEAAAYILEMAEEAHKQIEG